MIFSTLHVVYIHSIMSISLKVSRTCSTNHHCAFKLFPHLVHLIANKDHFTLELEGPPLMIYNLCDWSRRGPKTVQVHLTPDLEGLRDKKKLSAWKKNLHDNKWTTFHDLQDVALGPSKRSGSNAKTGTMAMNQTAIGF